MQVVAAGVFMHHTSTFCGTYRSMWNLRGSVRVTFVIYCVLNVCQAQHSFALHALCRLVPMGGMYVLYLCLIDKKTVVHGG